MQALQKSRPGVPEAAAAYLERAAASGSERCCGPQERASIKTSPTTGSPKEMCAHVEVTNAAGDPVGSFFAAGFRAWKAKMQKDLGAKVAIALEDTLIVDTPKLMFSLRPGSYKGVLVTKAPIPLSARRHLKDCDLWKAV